MWKYRISYDGGFLMDSEDLGYIYETEEEAMEEANADIESYIDDWEIDGCEYGKELFEVIIEEV